MKRLQAWLAGIMNLTFGMRTQLAVINDEDTTSVYYKFPRSQRIVQAIFIWVANCDAKNKIGHYFVWFPFLKTLNWFRLGKNHKSILS